MYLAIICNQSKLVVSLGYQKAKPYFQFQK
jgi:hypothetical protein